MINELKRKKLEKELLDEDPNIFNNFDEKRSIGENNSYICTLIRNDSIVDFIAHVNEKKAFHFQVHKLNHYFLKLTHYYD